MSVLATELEMVGIAPVHGLIHRTLRSQRRPGWGETACGRRKRLLPSTWRKPEDRPCEECWR